MCTKEAEVDAVLKCKVVAMNLQWILLRAAVTGSLVAGIEFHTIVNVLLWFVVKTLRL